MVFFFKQKTAYEVRIRDWSTDVCSSDLKCRQCQQMVFVKEWEDNLSVCPRCDHHDRIGAKKRFAQLFDGGLHEILFAPAAPEDPLKFRETKKHVDGIKAARAKTGDRTASQKGLKWEERRGGEERDGR